MRKETVNLLNQKPSKECIDCKIEFDEKVEEVQTLIHLYDGVKMVNTNKCAWCFDLS